MKLKRIKKLGILLMILLAFPVTAYGGTIDDMLMTLTIPAAKPTELIFKVEAINIPQFSETRTGWLNDLLKHMTFRVRSDGNIQDEEIDIDGKPAIECITRDNNGNPEFRFSFDDRIYVSENENDLSGMLTGLVPDDEMNEYYSRLQVLLPEFYRFFSGLPELFPDCANETKVSIQYKGYGTAVKRYAMVLGQDVLSSEQMTEYLGNGEMTHVRDFLSKAVLNGKQRLTLLCDADGNLMKVNYTGKSGLNGGSIRNTDVDWRCLKNGYDYKDVLVLKTPAVTGTERHNVTLNREYRQQPEGAEEYRCTIDTDEVRNRIRSRIRFELSLDAADGKISGNAEIKKNSSGLNDISKYIIDIISGEGEEYRGSLEIAHELNKIEREHFRADFTWAVCEAPVWENAGKYVSAEQDIQNIRLKAAGVFLRAIADIPEKDLQYIIADLPDNWWKQTIKKTEKPEDTEKP